MCDCVSVCVCACVVVCVCVYLVCICNIAKFFAGKWNKTTAVAIKTLKPNSMTPEAFLGEAHLMKQFQHPHIVRLYAVCTVGEPILIVTELLLDSLLHYLREPVGRALGLKTLIDMAGQVSFSLLLLQ